MNFNLPDFKVNNIYRLTLYVSLAILVGSFFFEIQNTFVCQVCQTDIFGHKLSFSSDVCYLRYVSFLLVLISLIAWGADGQLQRPLRKLQYNIRFIEKMIDVSKDIDNKEKIKELIECYEYNYLEYNEEDDKYERRRLCVDFTHFVALLIIIILPFDGTWAAILISIYIIIIIGIVTGYLQKMWKNVCDLVSMVYGWLKRQKNKVWRRP